MFRRKDLKNLEEFADELRAAFYSNEYTSILMDIEKKDDGYDMHVELSNGDKRLELHHTRTSIKEVKNIWLKPEYTTIYHEESDYTILEEKK